MPPQFETCPACGSTYVVGAAGDGVSPHTVEQCRERRNFPEKSVDNVTDVCYTTDTEEHI